MSFEGYNEYRCGCGNIDAANVYDNAPTKCGKCGNSYSRIRQIDCTNGKHVGQWRDVEYRPKFKDYVRKGYYD